VIPLKKEEVLGWLLVCSQFAIGVAREIDRDEAPQCLALIRRA
jgi:hypothetical protein